MLVQKSRLYTHFFDDTDVELLCPLKDLSAVFILILASLEQLNFLGLTRLLSQLDQAPPQDHAGGEVGHQPTGCVLCCVTECGKVGTALSFGVIALWRGRGGAGGGATSGEVPTNILKQSLLDMMAWTHWVRWE